MKAIKFTDKVFKEISFQKPRSNFERVFHHEIRKRPLFLVFSPSDPIYQQKE